MKLFVFVFGLGCGAVCMVFVLNHNTKLSLPSLGIQKPVVMGFLPYWLISDDEKDYSPYLNTISYFGLSIDQDGTILKRMRPTETEPGWLAMQSRKMSPILDAAKEKGLKRSLVVFSGDQEKINQLVENPVGHAKTLINEISPILTQYDFNDLNIDIENTSLASESARQNFTLLMKTIYGQLQSRNNSITLSIDVSPTALIQPYLIDVAAISPFVDKVIFMTYDFHYPGSSVTGAVSPVNGAGVSTEFDTETSIREALKILDPEKIILGAPLYGYEWETLNGYPHAAVIPGTGIVASNKRVEDLLSSCASCSAQFDSVSKESYLIYKDRETGTFHQFFFPDEQAMQEKINLMKKYNLGGIVLWALGYEGNTILEPLKNLK